MWVGTWAGLHPAVRIVASVLMGMTILELAWREDGRPCLAWGPAGVSYRSAFRSGALRWEALEVHPGGQGLEVRVSGVPWSNAVNDGDAAKRKAIGIGSSGERTPRWLRWWSNSRTGLIHALELAHARSGEAEPAQMQPCALPVVTRSVALYVTWAVLTALTLLAVKIAS